MTRSTTATRLPRLQRGLLLATVLGVAVTIFPGMIEPVMLPKASLAVAGAMLITVVAAVQLLLSGRLQVPWSRPLWLLGGLVVAMLVVTVVSADSATSLLGRYTRYSGLAEYAAYAVLLSAVALLYRRRSLAPLTWTLLGSLLFVLIYAAVQLAGLDPVGWRTFGRNDPVFSTMGNTNFASAYAGILVPLALATALDRERRLRLRALAAVIGVLAFGYTLLLQVIQGPVVALVGSAFVLLAHGDLRSVVGRLARRRWQVAGGLGLLVTLGVSLRLAAFIAGDLPNSLHQRSQLWAAAVNMFRDRPFVGLGLDSYGDYFSAYRPVSHAAERGVAYIDAPHQVPLGMFASGGLLLGLTYVAFVVTVAVVLVRGIRSSTGSHRLVLAGYGGAWVAYQVQSLVSLDVPPVALLHFVTAGAVLALAAPAVLRPVGPRVAVPAPRLVAATIGVLVSTPALLFIVRPFAADVAAGAALREARNGNSVAAREWTLDAVKLMPYEPSYQRALGSRLAEVDPLASQRAYERAATMEYSSVRYARDALRLARQLGDEPAEQKWQDELARRDPYNRTLVAGVAEYHLQGGRVDRSRELYEQLLEAYPNDPVALRGLAATDGSS